MCSRWANSACSCGRLRADADERRAVARRAPAARRGTRSSAACSRAHRGCRPSRRAAAGPACPCAGRRRRRGARAPPRRGRARRPASRAGPRRGPRSPGGDRRRRRRRAPGGRREGSESVLMTAILAYGRQRVRAHRVRVPGRRRRLGRLRPRRAAERGRARRLPARGGPRLRARTTAGAGRATSSTRASSPSRTRGRPSARTARSCARGSWAAARRTTRASCWRARPPTTTSGARAGATRPSRRTSSAPSASCACAGSPTRSSRPGIAPSRRPRAPTRSCTRSTTSAPCAGTPPSPTSIAARGRENLTIRADTLVDRVLLRRRPRRRASRPATASCAPSTSSLAAGAYGSPGILLRSGVGPQRGLPVGEGLIDHVGVGFGFEADRPAAARGGGIRARPAALHVAGDHPGAQQRVRRGRVRPLLLPRARSAGPSGLRGQRRRLRDEARLARDRPPDLARPARAAGHRPRLPLRRARRRGPRRGRRGAARDWRRPRRSAPTRRARRARAPRSTPSATCATRRAASSIRSGTCAIGAVVDGDGRVHGCEGLSVADASIMPSIPRANTNLEHDRAGRAAGRADAGASADLAQQRPHDAQHAGERAALQAVRRVARRVPARLVGNAELRRGRAGERELAVVGVARRAVAQPGDVRRSRGAAAPRISVSTLARAVATGERSSKRVPRPTSSRASARRTSRRRFVRRRRRTSAAAPRWSGCPV